MKHIINSTKYLHSAIDFKQIKAESFIPALTAAIQDAKAELDTLKNNQRPISFENTVEHLESITENISLLSNTFFSLHSAETSPELEKVAGEFSPMLTEFHNEMLLDDQIFLKIKGCYQDRKQMQLEGEELKLVEETYHDFVRNGSLLDKDKKAQLKEIDLKLATLSLKFGSNILAAKNAYFLKVDDKSKLTGLPSDLIEKAQELAKKKNAQGFYFGLDFPTLGPFLKYADDRKLRQEIYMANGTLAVGDSDTDNSHIIRKIVTLRKSRAKLLGHDSHASFILEKRMAKSVKGVNDFLDQLYDKAAPFAKNEMDELIAFQKSLNPHEEKLEKWDYSYYAEKLKQKKFNFDDESIKPYFPLDNVVEGMFAVADKLYNLKFKQLTDIPTYHEDAIVYEVHDQSDGKFIGLFYADFFPREGKRQGAWMTIFKDQFIKDGIDHRPHVSIVCNFPRPSTTTPALLGLRDVETLFHEFGHALHALLTKCKYRRFSGTNVYWDFVELPSQIMENWVYEKDCLKLFAKHYKTNEALSETMIENMRNSVKFHSGYATLRQLSLANLDMAWHTGDPESVSDVLAHETEAIRKTELFPPIEGTSTSCQFSHIFQGGYSAGYYSYKWAEVLDADAFETFKKHGIFNKDIAQKFRESILTKGGTQHPMDLYIDFCGHAPNVEALLKRSGLSHTH